MGSTVALGVVLAAAGYPAEVRKGDVIHGLGADKPDAMVFHAATARQGADTVTAGGRVLCVTALGDTVRQAQTRAYEMVDSLHFDGMQVRRDEITKPGFVKFHFRKRTGGGRIVFQGTVEELRRSGTLTGRHLDDRAALKPAVRTRTGVLEVRGASSHMDRLPSPCRVACCR